MLPNNIRKVMATDVNKKMVLTASLQYSHLNVEFDILDIGAELPKKFYAKFDHVFSFFCLHWVSDQR